MTTKENALRKKGAGATTSNSDFTTPASNTSSINRSSELINRLSKVKRTGQSRWIACCPAHDDKHPSLAIREDNGTILLKCFGGCRVYEIVSAIGLNLSDLFPPSNDPKYIKHSRQGFSAWQLMHVLKPDLIRLLIISNDLKKIEAISDDDRQFISEVVIRLNEGIAHMDGAR